MEKIHDTIIKKVLKEELYKIANAKRRLDEYSYTRNEYINRCLDRVDVVFEHLAKICIFEKYDGFSQCVEHWKQEIQAQLDYLLKIRFVDDNTACTRQQKAFVHSFIDCPLGKDFAHYNDIVGDFEEALNNENLTQEEIDSIDIEEIVSVNEKRIKNFLLSCVPLVSLKDKTTRKNALTQLLNNF